MKLKMIGALERGILEKVKIYGVILLYCLMVCSPLLQMHIASDTYNLMDLGYFAYPSQYFLRDARIVSALMTYLAGVLHLSYPVFIVGMELLAVVVTAISIGLLYQAVKEKIGEKNHDIKTILIFMAASTVIFNCMGLEYLLYAECAVMCLSVLLCVIAARIFTSQAKLKWLKTLLCIMLATFCYQGSINIFITLVVLFLMIGPKQKVKDYIKQILLAGVIYGLSLLCNVIAMYLINLLLGNEQGRISEGGLFYNLSLFIPLLCYVIENYIIRTINLWPFAIIPIMIGVSAILITFSKKPTENIIKYLFLIFIAISVCIVPIFFMKNPSMEPRMAMSIGAIVGISLLYINSIDIGQNRVLKKLVIILTIGFFIWNTITVIQIFTAHIATNKIDANMGQTIKYKIEQYEKETGHTITKVAYHRDDNHRDFPYGYEKKLSSFTQRAFDNYYCIIEALNYYCNRKFERVTMDEEIYKEYFLGKDWDAYAEEQIVLKGDTMYLCTY